MWRPQTVAIRQGTRANTHHTIQGYMISKVSEWAIQDSKDSNWFSLTLDFPVMSCIRRRVWRQVTCFQILTPPFLAVSSQANHLNPLSPNFFFLPIYLPIHTSIFYLHLLQQVVLKKKRGSIKREALWKLQMHKLIAIAQVMIDGQGLRPRPKLRLSIVWGFLGFEASVREGAWAKRRWLPG